MSVEEILMKLTEWSCDHVVLTGGEPMIAPALPDLAETLKKQGKHITIETAGTIFPNGIPCDLASLSPKLSNSTPSLERDPAWAKKHEATRLQPEVISEWIRKYPFQLKFVVSSGKRPGRNQISPSKASQNLADRVLLMPEGVDTQTLASRSSWLVDICKREGFRLCPRLQIELFGHTRGT